MKRLAISWMIFALPVPFLSSGCPAITSPDFTQAAPTDTPATNAVRMRLGIRLIEDSWKFRYREFGEEKWEACPQSPGVSKVVKRVAKGDIAWEFDNYPSGKTYLHPDPDSSAPSPEFLVVHYEYGPGRFFLNYAGTDPAVDRLLRTLPMAPYDPAEVGQIKTRGSAYQGESDDQTLRVADQILSGWSLKRSDSCPNR